MNSYKTPGIISIVIEPRNLQSLAEEKFKNAKPTIQKPSPKTQQKKKKFKARFIGIRVRKEQRKGRNKLQIIPEIKNPGLKEYRTVTKNP